MYGQEVYSTLLSQKLPQNCKSKSIKAPMDYKFVEHSSLSILSESEVKDSKEFHSALKEKTHMRQTLKSYQCFHWQKYKATGYH